MRQAILFLMIILLPVAAQAQRADVPKRPVGVQAFEHKDGPFSAMLMILDSGAMAEFQKPSNQGLHLTAKNKAKRGERVNVVIGFMGFALDYDMNARITFDFRITGPDGKPVGEPAKDIPGLTGKIANPFMVYHTQSEVAFAFDTTDKNGVYTIDAIIRDEVGKKTIPLHGTIELVD